MDDKKLKAFHLDKECCFVKNNQAQEQTCKFQDCDIMELYLRKKWQSLLSNGLIEFCTESILYYFQRKKRVSEFILRCTAQLYIWQQEREILKEEEYLKRRKEEREFFLNLISYNENPTKNSQYFIEYLESNGKAIRELEKIRVNCFGTFLVQIISDGKILKWRTKKGGELFAFLFHRQGEPIGRQALLEALWPEELPNNAVCMLHNMIYHIRKELAPYGLEDIVQYKEKMYSLKMEWIQSELNEQKALYNTKDMYMSPEYPGPYMGNIDNNWAADSREFYDSLYIKYCQEISSLCIEQKNYEQAIVLLKNIRKVDNLREDVFEKLIYCYGKTHDKKRVMEEYNAFVHLLNKELGVEPCERVKKTYAKLIK